MYYDARLKNHSLKQRENEHYAHVRACVWDSLCNRRERENLAMLEVQREEQEQMETELKNELRKQQKKLERIKSIVPDFSEEQILADLIDLKGDEDEVVARLLARASGTYESESDSDSDYGFDDEV